MGLSFSTLDQNKKIDELLIQFEMYKQSCKLELDVVKNENKKHIVKFQKYQKAYEDLVKHNKIEIKEYKKQINQYKDLVEKKDNQLKVLEKQLFDVNLKLLKYNEVMSKINSINTTIDGIYNPGISQG